MIFKCPGQDKRNLKIHTIKCPNCGYEMEFFSDEIKLRCPKCKGEVTRKALPSCIDWCKYAKDCIGKEIYEKYVKDKS